MTTTDKTGAPTTVTAGTGRYAIAVEGQEVGHAEFRDSDDRRVFTHTEVDKGYEGRGLATILISEALQAARADGRQIVAVCPMVAAYVKKHPELDAIVPGDDDS